MLSPLGWAAVFAIVVHPLYVRLDRRWGSSGAALVSTLALAVALVVPAVALTMIVAGEAIDASASLQRAIADGRVARLAHSGGWVALRSGWSASRSRCSGA